MSDAGFSWNLQQLYLSSQISIERPIPFNLLEDGKNRSAARVRSARMAKRGREPGQEKRMAKRGREPGREKTFALENKEFYHEKKVPMSLKPKLFENSLKRDANDFAREHYGVVSKRFNILDHKVNADRLYRSALKYLMPKIVLATHDSAIVHLILKSLGEFGAEIVDIPSVSTVFIKIP
uniref:Uncharacterized protein n=1 Tax=Parascaris univalens TaxID=6257 RepID=A0A915ATH8_PARUN